MIAQTVDSWVSEQDLPVRAGIKVIRINDQDYGLSEDEIEDRNEFIRCFLLREFEFLLSIPVQAPEHDFFIPDCDSESELYSAFNSMDYHRGIPPFDGFGYAMKKLLERVQDLAIIHSCASLPEDRQKMYERYQCLVERELQLSILKVIERYRSEIFDDRKARLRDKLGTLHQKLFQCRKIWERYAPPENWDT